MFRGRSKHVLDEKGRLAIPTRFKEVLKAKEDNCLVLTNHYNCLWAYKLEDWRLMEQKVAGYNQFDDGVGVLQRYFYSGAQECPLKQGRITIPPDLREISGLKKEVVLVGRLKIFEIWDREKWEIEFEKAKGSFPEVTQKIPGLGL
jgi:MraZ protein